MINDNTDSKTLLKKLFHNPNTYFLFDPKAHFTNAQTLYLAMKKLTGERYYGKKGKKTKRNNEEGGSNRVVGGKGTPFENC